MAKYEFLRSDLDSMNLEIATIRLVEGCISDILKWRIRVEMNDKLYYLVDFSDDGKPFSNGTACRLRLCGSKEPCLNRTFTSLFEVFPVIRQMLSACKIAYVDSY